MSDLVEQMPSNEYFARYWMPEPTSGCWLWTGAITGRGYGSFHWEGRTRVAHRISYRLAGHSIPAGRVLDHKCRVKSCVNPAHLRAVTSQENTLIGEGPTATNVWKTHCIGGHLLDESTLTKRGWRECRVCKRNHERRYRKAAALSIGHEE